jgi:hypothetical protein
MECRTFLAGKRDSSVPIRTRRVEVQRFKVVGRGVDWFDATVEMCGKVERPECVASPHLKVERENARRRQRPAKGSPHPCKTNPYGWPTLDVALLYGFWARSSRASAFVGRLSGLRDLGNSITLAESSAVPSLPPAIVVPVANQILVNILVNEG